MREVLAVVCVYKARRADYERVESCAIAVRRFEIEGLLPVLDGRIPMILDADQASDIESAVALSREFGFRLIISGGSEAWEVADRLAAAKVPVLTGAMNNIPQSFAQLGQRQENAGLLAKAGVTV